MTDASSAHASMTDALNRLHRDDVPGLEFLVLQQVMGWALSEENPGSGYDQQQASRLVGALFGGLNEALKATLGQRPEETPAMATARERLVEGAHELARAGEDGLNTLIGARLLPAVLAELERSAGNPTQQGAGVWATLLYGVAMGTGEEHDEAIMAGFVEGFDAWTTLISAL